MEKEIKSKVYGLDESLNPLDSTCSSSNIQLCRSFSNFPLLEQLQASYNPLGLCLVYNLSTSHQASILITTMINKSKFSTYKW